MNIPRTSTDRILVIYCPTCGEMLQVNVNGLPAGVSAEEWLNALTVEDTAELHNRHLDVDTPSIPRTRTRLARNSG